MGGLGFFGAEATGPSSDFAQEKQRGSRALDESERKAPLLGFTGYIADNETGLLHARARQYSPTLGRFVGRDPVRYKEGYNLYRGYFAPNGLDPEGLATLSYTTESEPQKGDCNNVGYGTWVIQWKLTGNLGAERGSVIQKVYFDVEERDCSGAIIKQDYYWYWEAWGVSTQGGNGIEFIDMTGSKDRWFRWEGKKTCSKGHITQIGRADFYPIPIGDLTGWRPGRDWNDPRINSDGLPSFPGGYPGVAGIDNPPNGVVRVLNYIWNCCPGNDTHILFHN